MTPCIKSDFLTATDQELTSSKLRHPYSIAFVLCRRDWQSLPAKQDHDVLTGQTLEECEQLLFGAIGHTI